MDFVEAILDKRIAIHCESGLLKKKLMDRGGVADNAVPNRWTLLFKSKEELASHLSLLQSLNIPFCDEPHGWPPAAVFENLRDEGLVQGGIRKIAWRGPNQPLITEVTPREIKKPWWRVW